MALSTVRPPTPESNIPMGRRSLTYPPGLNGLDGETVTQAWDGLEADAGVGQIRQLAPETLNVRIHRVIVQIVRVAPHLVAKLGSCEDALGIRCEHGKKIELGHGQRDLVVPHLDPPGGIVDLERADREDPLTPWACLGQSRAPQMSVDASG